MQNINLPSSADHLKHLKSTKQPKSIFCYCVYKTNHPNNHHHTKPHHRNNFKSSSAGNSLWQESEVLYINEKLLKPKEHKTTPIKSSNISDSNPKQRECSTQTSKTIIQLAKMDTGCMSPDSLTRSPRNNQNVIGDFVSSMANCPYSVSNRLSTSTFEEGCHEQDCIFNRHNKKQDLVTDYLRKKYTQPFVSMEEEAEPRNIFPNHKEVSTTMRSKSFVESHYQHPNYISETIEHDPPLQVQRQKLITPPIVQPVIVQPQIVVEAPPRVEPFKLNRKSSKSLNLPDNSRFKTPSLFYVPNGTFMCPTTSSKIKSRKDEIQSVNNLIPPMRGGRSTSPKPSSDQRRFESSRKIPYIDQSKSDMSSATTIVNTMRNPVKLKRAVEQKNVGAVCEVEVGSERSVKELVHCSVDSTVCVAVNRFRDDDWQTALKGLAEIVELCRLLDIEAVYEHMTAINQRLIETLKSPRSHVCRTACQAAGHLFEYVKDTRKPEFDDIVDLLLFKTADANKFIRHDANLALDCMVTHISTFNSVRALCAKGPFHKNNLVRCATVRLLVCATVIAGTEYILNPNNSEYTRKRIIVNMARFLEDKNLETRKFAERLYKVLAKDVRFDTYLRQYLEKERILKIKKTLKLVQKK